MGWWLVESVFRYAASAALRALLAEKETMVRGEPPELHNREGDKSEGISSGSSLCRALVK